MLSGLAVATVVSLVGAFVLGRPWAWAAHLSVVVVFAAYLGGLRRLQRLAVERRVKVRYLPATAPMPSAAPAVTDERRRSTASR